MCESKKVFIGNLPREFKDGDKITIEGKIAENASIFMWHLESHDYNSPNERKNTSYRQKLFLNKNQQHLFWNEDGIEKIVQGEGGYLKRGDPFQIMIVLFKNKILIYNFKNNIGLIEDVKKANDIKCVKIYGIEKMDSMKMEFADCV